MDRFHAKNNQTNPSEKNPILSMIRNAKDRGYTKSVLEGLVFHCAVKHKRPPRDGSVLVTGRM